MPAAVSGESCNADESVSREPMAWSKAEAARSTDQRLRSAKAAPAQRPRVAHKVGRAQSQRSGVLAVLLRMGAKALANGVATKSGKTFAATIAQRPSVEPTSKPIDAVLIVAANWARARVRATKVLVAESEAEVGSMVRGCMRKIERYEHLAAVL